jgi:hypothetical protein
MSAEERRSDKKIHDLAKSVGAENPEESVYLAAAPDPARQLSNRPWGLIQFADPP